MDIARLGLGGGGGQEGVTKYKKQWWGKLKKHHKLMKLESVIIPIMIASIGTAAGLGVDHGRGWLGRTVCL